MIYRSASIDRSLNPLAGGAFIHSADCLAEAVPLRDRFSLRGKSAIVTGGAAGIGWAVVQAFAEMGANIAIWYNTNKQGPARAREIETRYGVRCECSLSKDPRQGLTVVQVSPIRSTSSIRRQSRLLLMLRFRN